MALVSPGLEIDIIDDSQYVSSGVGTVPFVLLATAQDKTFQGQPAAYTSKANAGQLLSASSQRDLITNLGYPTFQTSSAGTPLNANETNEYGLMAAYSAMGVSNKMYLMRADIDLKQIAGSANRPVGLPANGLYWLNTNSSTWGIYEWNTVTQGFVNRIPTIITDPTQLVAPVLGIPYPNQSVGSIGSYATVISNMTGATTLPLIFYKGSDNNWTQVGTTTWQAEWPAVTGNVAAVGGSYSASIVTTTMTINGINLTFSSQVLSIIVSQINGLNIPGVTASIVNTNQLAINVTSAATNGAAVITGGTGTSGLSYLGISAGTYAAPAIQYSGYVNVPNWRSTDTTPAPSGSIWFKTSTLGSGANIVINEFNAGTDSWTPIATPIYQDDAAAIYSLDPLGGGNNIPAATVYIQQDPLYSGNSTIIGTATVGSGAYYPLDRAKQGALSVTSANVSPVFSTTDVIGVSVTQLGLSTWLTATANIVGTGATGAIDFATTISSMNLPYVTASVAPSGAITLSHSAGGSIKLYNVTGTPVHESGLDSTPGVRAITENGITKYLASNFTPLTYTYSATTPYTAPVDGTLWFFNSPLDVDIMINETTGWKGYRTVSSDARGYNLVNTDPNGPIMAPVAPITQSDGKTPVVKGDLWINTGDLANFPVISRCTVSGAVPIWTLIDNTDSVDQNGIVFADARWDGWINPNTLATNAAQVDPTAGTMPSIAKLLNSNFIDLDCPDYRLYPRGTLLFNLRRSGYNVKHYVSQYFTLQAYPNATSLPTYPATWVTSSGLQNNGAPYAGSGAQRAIVIKALKAAIDGSDTLREESFQFNLIVCPGYPELIADMVALNNDRKNTAFTIGDTPMTLAANAIDITNWSTDATGKGLATADPYMGVYYPSGQTTDLSGNTIIVPPSHMILRAAIKSDSVSYPWFAFAGTRRGLVDNATDLGYVDANSGEFMRNGLNQGMRDTLYTLAINPVALLPGTGITVFGNKTRSGTTSSLDRVNVARLVNYIRTILSSVSNSYLFEPNDKTTWDSIGQVISSAMNDLVTKRGIYDYAVICDSSNNTSDRIANNELYVDIAIEPEKDVEFIYIPIRLMNPGTIAGSGK